MLAVWAAREMVVPVILPNRNATISVRNFVAFFPITKYFIFS